MKTTLLQQVQALAYAKNELVSKIHKFRLDYEEERMIIDHIDALTDVETVLRNREARHPHGSGRRAKGKD